MIKMLAWTPPKLQISKDLLLQRTKKNTFPGKVSNIYPLHSDKLSTRNDLLKVVIDTLVNRPILEVIFIKLKSYSMPKYLSIHGNLQ